ncbi:sodium-dependent neutral amino acid transporter B(0)AT3-like [Mytilus californianus]|uniref:sodium-dependent neutral amino acid transporter B(0)AT3-like n=1 Tax=Mytilus californianus TaxID=6549 RepID=UPI00224639DF|nr:sodium-dependent neutral amino acid transporter B(0)AT3-like [Mytilus californianus]
MTKKKKQNNGTMKGQVNKGMDTSSVFTIESSASNWRESRETLTTDTHTPVQMSRRNSFSSAMESGSIFSGSIGSVPSKASALSTDALLLKQKTSSEDIEGQSTERESWDNKVQYLLAVVGFAVGLGNVWRFPYLAQKNGGGAFLIPYVIMLAIEGIPLFYLELAVGQRLRKGAIGAWNEVSPFLGGIGIACCFVSFWVALYYNTIIAWCLYYLVLSFRATLPWAACPDPVPKECNMSSPTTYFWYRKTLDISSSVEETGNLNWWILVSLFVAWLIVFLCMIKGIASSGKVVYVTATFPYLVLIIFFFRGVTLEGFQHGLEYFFVPDFSRLGDPQVWLEAATQIFFSLGLAFGGLIAFSSYMPVRNNCYVDAILVSVINCGTSVFAGIVIFSILGFKANNSYNECLATRNSQLIRLFNTTDLTVPEAGTQTTFTVFEPSLQRWIQKLGIMPELPVCDLQAELQKSGSGTGLAFIAFTEAINQFPAAPFWSILFFLMLLTLGLDSMFGTLEGVVTSIMDMNLISNLRKDVLAGVLCAVSLLMSFGFATQNGPYIFVLFDEFSGNIPLLVIAFFEVIGISYFYGLKRFGDDISLMIGYRPNYYWLIMWKYVSPLAIVVIFLASVIKMAVTGTTYDAWDSATATTTALSWPGGHKFVAAFLILTAVLWIPGVALVKYFRLIKWEPETPAYFPEEELKIEKELKIYEPSDMERKLFYWREVLD